MIKSHKIQLNPTKKQSDYFFKNANAARYAFNWGLAEYNRILDHNFQVNKTGQGEKIKVSGRLLKVQFNKVKPDWFLETSTWAYQGAFDDLQKSFSNYWHKCKAGTNKPPKKWKPRKDGKPFGWPKFKSKYRTIPSFYQANQALKFDGFNIKLPKIGWVNMTEPLRFNGKIMGSRISFRNGRWWLSVQIDTNEKEQIEHPNQNDAIGIDLGIKYLATTSDGQIFNNPKAYYKAQKKLKKLQRKLDRQIRANNPDNYNENGTPKKGVNEWVKSNRMLQTMEKISELHFRIANIRNEASHLLTTELTQQYGIICLEDLNIKGMLSNGHLSKAVSDAALYEKRRQFEYKAKWNGGTVLYVDRWFPSSKQCSNCNWINSELKLSDRKWYCKECGTLNHRDFNAAVNIKNECIGRTTQADN